jgi:selenocysteine lyase/cysteine desulfurase
LIRYIEFVNGAPLRNQNDVLFPHKETARIRLSRIANCSPEEIALTRNTTEALNAVIFGLDFRPGDEILTTNLEYYSMLNALEQRAQRDGVKVRKVSFPTLPCPPDLVLKTISNEVTSATRVIFISHIVDSNGQINPVQRICEMARSRGIQVVVDGALSFGYIPVDLKAIGCDYYGTSLHKGMHAPLGTGFLYVKKENIPLVWPLFGTNEPAGSIRKFESIGTHPVSQFAVINQALDFHEAIGAERKQARLHYLKKRWTDKLEENDNFEFHTSLEPDQSCGIVNVKIRNVDTVKLYQYLRDKHQMLAWPIQEKIVEGLWVSPLIYSRLEDLDAFANVMIKVTKEGLPA